MLDENAVKKKKFDFSSLLRTEDWWTLWLGLLLLVLAAAGLITVIPRLPGWSDNIADALPLDLVPQLLLLGLSLALVSSIAVGTIKKSGKEMKKFLTGFPLIFVLAVLAYIFGNQASLKHYGFSDVIWALVFGLVISNVFGKPKWLVPALRTELFIKIGLVLMGAEILFNRILTLGVYGLGVAWIVTPIVIFAMYQYGIRGLKMKNKSLVATISACTSVCGVSAAIATGAATKAKKEEVSMAISISLIFTVIMMIGEPLLIKWLNLSEAVGGAWIGGTVDSTGAVVVAGSMVGPLAMEIAAVVKMLQNVLIGLVAFVFAMIFVVQEQNQLRQRPKVAEIWHRMPKFIIGFVLASIVFSFVLIPLMGQESVDEILTVTAALRKWLFTLAFVSIGLDSRISDLAKMCKGGKPIILYVVGQTFNLLLTLLAAWIFFSGKFFGSV
ncbi:MAG: putative sulfate exporter family transporter [Firmicutes bacterium]|nr:putative sulfate exporter family transporter [Bacillota bacterium]